MCCAGMFRIYWTQIWCCNIIFFACQTLFVEVKCDHWLLLIFHNWSVRASLPWISGGHPKKCICWILSCWFPQWCIYHRSSCLLTEAFWNAVAMGGHWSPSGGASCTPSTCRPSHGRMPPASTQPGSSGGASTAGWLTGSGMLQVSSGRKKKSICCVLISAARLLSSPRSDSPQFQPSQLMPTPEPEWSAAPWPTRSSWQARNWHSVICREKKKSHSFFASAGG